MKNTLLKSIFALATITIIFYSCSKDEPATPGNIGSGNNTGNGNNNSEAERNAAIQEYNDNFLGSNITDAGWTGNIANCNAGTVSQACSDAVIKRINYFLLTSVATIPMNLQNYIKICLSSQKMKERRN